MISFYLRDLFERDDQEINRDTPTIYHDHRSGGTRVAPNAHMTNRIMSHQGQCIALMIKLDTERKQTVANPNYNCSPISRTRTICILKTVPLQLLLRSRVRNKDYLHFPLPKQTHRSYAILSSFCRMIDGQ